MIGVCYPSLNIHTMKESHSNAFVESHKMAECLAKGELPYLLCKFLMLLKLSLFCTRQNLLHEVQSSIYIQVNPESEQAEQKQLR